MRAWTVLCSPGVGMAYSAAAVSSSGQIEIVDPDLRRHQLVQQGAKEFVRASPFSDGGDVSWRQQFAMAARDVPLLLVGRQRNFKHRNLVAVVDLLG